MTRAEQAARKAYPINKPKIICKEAQKILQEVYSEGYEQAEQDLALTWEDIKAIVTIADSMITHTAWDAIDWPDEQKYYEEVLRRFNEQRHDKETQSNNHNGD